MNRPEPNLVYDPVQFAPKAFAQEKRQQSASFDAAYSALDDEFSTLAGLLQADVAKRMGVSQPVLARIESSLGSRKHSPSLATLRAYAAACGKKLLIQIV